VKWIVTWSESCDDFFEFPRPPGRTPLDPEPKPGRGSCPGGERAAALRLLDHRRGGDPAVTIIPRGRGDGDGHLDLPLRAPREGAGEGHHGPRVLLDLGVLHAEDRDLDGVAGHEADGGGGGRGGGGHDREGLGGDPEVGRREAANHAVAGGGRGGGLGHGGLGHGGLVGVTPEPPRHRGGGGVDGGDGHPPRHRRQEGGEGDGGAPAAARGGEPLVVGAAGRPAPVSGGEDEGGDEGGDEGDDEGRLRPDAVADEDEGEGEEGPPPPVGGGGVGRGRSLVDVRGGGEHGGVGHGGKPFTYAAFQAGRHL